MVYGHGQAKKCSDAREELLQHLVRPLTQVVDHIIVLPNVRSQDIMRKAVTVDEDCDASETVACSFGSSTFRCQEDVVGLDVFAVTGLVVADEECDILCPRSTQTRESGIVLTA